MKLRLLVNPAAGRGKARRRLVKIRRYLESRRLDFDCRLSEGPGHLTDLTSELSLRRGGEDIPVVCGGDGTVNEVINGLDGSSPPLGILPCGTGDDIARNLGIPRGIPEACDVILNGQVRTLDLVKAGNRRFLTIGGAGIDSEVTRRANRSRLPLPGPLLYSWAVLLALFSFRPRRFTITADGRRYEGRLMFAAVANAPVYGGGMRLSPDSLMDDGRMEICIVEAMGRLELLGNFPKIFRGTHLAHPKFRVLQSRRARIESREEAEFYADGEFHQLLPIDVAVLPGALSVLTPAARCAADIPLLARAAAIS
jgi:diacylglycerol kinase (ATP)